MWKHKKGDMGDGLDYQKDKFSSKNIKKFLYDCEEKKVLGRTAKGWALIILYYAIFYILLSAMFAFCMWVVTLTLSEKKPKWCLDKSIIGTNPGLGYRPMPELKNLETALIWYSVADPENYKFWVHSLGKFLEVYQEPRSIPGRERKLYNCDYDRPPGPNQVCDVNVSTFYPCTVENDFGYREGSPCFFLKLNKIYGWVPEYYNSTRCLPEHMPATLKNHIANVSMTRPQELNTVWVTCEGEDSVDTENLGTVSYIPRQGFPGYFFPYVNSEGYLSPIVAVHLANPKKGVLINLECKAWAKNIKHNRQYVLGSVHLEILVD